MTWYEITAYNDDDTPYALCETDNEQEAKDWQAYMEKQGKKAILTEHGDTQ